MNKIAGLDQEAWQRQDWPHGYTLGGVVKKFLSLIDLAELRGGEVGREFRAQLLDILDRLGVETIDCKKGVRFDRRLMNLGVAINTPFPDRHYSIASTLRLEFKMGDEVLRQATIAVFVYKENSVPLCKRT